MKRPLLCTFVFMIIGILAGQYLADVVSIVLFFVVILLASVLYVLRFKSIRHFIFLFFCGIGFLGIVNSNSFEYSIDNQSGFIVNETTDIVMSGIVKDISYTKTERQKIIVQVKAVYPFYGEKDSEGIDIHIKLQAVLEEGEEVFCGQEILYKGKIQSLSKPRNPGGFNEYQFLKSRKIQYKIFPIILEKGDITKTPAVWISDLKNRLAYVYDVCLPPREAGIAKSMIIGDTSGLEDETRDLYWKAGIFHILAISGLHISMIALALQLILNIRLNKRISGMITMLFLIFYCILTGASVSTVRAVVMSGVLIIGRMIYRDSDLITSTAFAGMCLLCYEPLYLFDMGFQYSFAAVFGLAIATEPFGRGFILIASRLPKTAAFLKHPIARDALPASMAADLATWPITAYHFYYAFPFSVIVNIIIVPSSSLVTLSGFCIGIGGLIHLKIGIFFSGFLFMMLKIYEAICSFFVALPVSQILIGREPLINLIAWYTFLGVTIYFLHGKREDGKYNDFIARGKYTAIAACIYMLCVTWHHLGAKDFKMTMLDVGQGDCMVIHKNKYTFIIDGGGLPNREIGTNTGKMFLNPYLEYSNIGYVDAVFLTHFDSDHATGIIELMNTKRQKIGTVFIPDRIGDDSGLYDLLISTAEAYKIPIKLLKAGDVVQSPEFTFECLHPFGDNDNLNLESAGGNESSLVIKMEYKKVDFLFTGDIGKKEEEKMIGTGVDLASDMLKVAHHGSKNSSSEEFMAGVAPKVAIISSGVHNVYGHPHTETLERLKKHGVIVYNTAWNGAILIGADDNEIQVKTMLGADNDETANE